MERSSTVQSIHLNSRLAHALKHLYVEVRTPHHTIRSAPVPVPNSCVAQIPLDIPSFSDVEVDLHVDGLDGQLLAHSTIKMENLSGGGSVVVQDATYWFPLYHFSATSPTKGQLIGRVLVQSSLWFKGQQPQWRLHGVLPSGVHFSPELAQPTQELRDLVPDMPSVTTVRETIEVLPEEMKCEITTAMRRIMIDILDAPLGPWALVHWLAIRLVAKNCSLVVGSLS